MSGPRRSSSTVRLTEHVLSALQAANFQLEEAWCCSCIWKAQLALQAELSIFRRIHGRLPRAKQQKTCSLSRLNETLQYTEHICITYCRRHSECKLSQNFRQKSMLSLSHVVYWLLMTAGYTSYISYLSAFLTPNVQLGEAHTYLTTC